jgi:hypothetical protein
MSKLDELRLEQTLIVEVVTTVPGWSLVCTAYDEGGGVWKIEDDTVFVNEVSLVRHPKERFSPKWRPLISKGRALTVVVKRLPDRSVIGRYAVERDLEA